jgi:hypothetical protein
MRKNKMPRLNKYYESRSNDKRFKLLHEEATYLDILKGRIGLTEKDPDAEIVEDYELEDGQTMLNEGKFGAAIKAGRAIATKGAGKVSSGLGLKQAAIASKRSKMIAANLAKAKGVSAIAAQKKALAGAKSLQKVARRKAILKTGGAALAVGAAGGYAASRNEDIEFTDEYIMNEWAKETLGEINISVARTASKEALKKAAMLRKARLTPGLTGRAAKAAGRPVRMGRL